VRQNPIQGTV